LVEALLTKIADLGNLCRECKAAAPANRLR
jgi:hypothetical protein